MTLAALAKLETLLTISGDDQAAYAGIGSRETPLDVCADMSAIAAALEARRFKLRSGGADRADKAFEDGLIGAGSDAKEIYIPWKGFNGSTSEFYPPYVDDRELGVEVEKIRGSFDPKSPVTAGDRPLTALDIAARARLIAEAFHPAWDRCSSGAQKLHSRNVHQILGMDLMTPCRFGVCWTKDGGPTGGTGQAMRIASGHGIHMLNLHNAMVRTRLKSALLAA